MSRKRKNKGGLGMHGEYDWEGGYQDPYNYQGNGHRSYMPKKGWDTGDAPKVCTDCSFLPKETKQEILIDHETWKVLMALCVKVKVEWQALLSGTIDEKGTLHISGYYIPKQEVGPAFVKNLDVIDDVFIREHNIIAGVHSHANMGCFFSTTDVDDTNMSLIKHNIVVNNKGEYKACSRVELPCGLVKFIDAEVFTVGSPDVVITGADKIKEKTWGFKANDYQAEKPRITHKPGDQSKAYHGMIEDGLRWCTICSLTPEEDSGACCTCWTKGLRHMLPDFTDENYQKASGRSYELRPHLSGKYLSQ